MVARTSASAVTSAAWYGRSMRRGSDSSQAVNSGPCTERKHDSPAEGARPGWEAAETPGSRHETDEEQTENDEIAAVVPHRFASQLAKFAKARPTCACEARACPPHDSPAGGASAA